MLIAEDNRTKEKTVININKFRQRLKASSSNSSKNNEYAYLNYIKKYNGTPYTFWQIQVPDKIKYTYEKNNATNLYNFQTNVDAMRSNQDKISMAWGATVLSIVFGIISAYPIGLIPQAIMAAGSVLSGGEGISSLIGYSTTIKSCQNNCVTYFNKVVPVSKP